MKYQMPEPAYSRAAFVGRHTETPIDHYYTATQVQAAFDAGRVAGLEAAKACQKLEIAIDGGGNHYYRPADARQCIDAIRNLASNAEVRGA